MPTALCAAWQDRSDSLADCDAILAYAWSDVRCSGEEPLWPSRSDWFYLPSDGVCAIGNDAQGLGRMTRVGSLFTGYGGLDMAVGGDLAWYSEIEPAACRVLAAHYPGVPNLGDVTAVDWSAVEPVDVLTGGYPCQPFSNAGKRLGEEDERHLWPYVKQAIGVLRPPLVILENVRGHLTLGFKTVLGEIAELGYDARWGIVRASDAGAPHQRARLFIAAYPKGATWRTTQPKNMVSSKPGTAEFGECHSQDSWGPYAKAIARWASIAGRVAPEPWINGRVNPTFVEWMMGLPKGHVTGHGLTLSQELRMLGNGVVPQQASLALRLLGVAA